jgi:hypothetical protein
MKCITEMIMNLTIFIWEGVAELFFSCPPTRRAHSALYTDNPGFKY